MVGCFRLLFLLCVSAYVVYFSLGLWALWLDVRLLVIRCFGLIVSVGYDGAGGLLVLRLFNCWLGFGLSLFCVWESGVCGLRLRWMLIGGGFCLRVVCD